MRLTLSWIALASSILLLSFTTPIDNNLFDSEFDCPGVEDFDALIALYNSTGGANWTNNTGWVDGAADTNCLPCGDATNDPWFGLTCNSSGRVTDIKLQFNSLTGIIPLEIGDFPFLRNLFLNNNNLTGSIPISIANLSSIREFKAYNNQLSGTIPVEIENLTTLTTIQIQANQLTGSLPVNIGNLTNLVSIYLDRNQLTGPIPASIANLDKILTLSLHDNMLSGFIPPEIGDMAKLRFLRLQDNQFGGSIPIELSNLLEIREIDFRSNMLTGSVPAELSVLSTLTQLKLNLNQLTGEIPSSLGNLSALTNLWINNNQLSGELPASLSNISGLQWIDLRFNQLSGNLPEEYGLLTNVTSFYLNDNQLEGCIPAGYSIFCDNNVDFSNNECLTSAITFDDFCNGIPCGVSSCGTEIVWTDMFNTSADDNTLTKDNLYGWNGGGASENILMVGEYGWAEFEVVDNTNRLMFGLSEFNENNHFNTIDHAIYVINGSLKFYQEGVNDSNGPAVANGDILRIERDGLGDIVYYQNDVEIKRFNTNLTVALTVDVSILDENGVISSAKTSFSIPTCDDGLLNGYEIAIDCGMACSACDGEDIVWTDFNNTTATTNTIVKNNTYGWNGGGASENVLAVGESGWAEFVVVNRTNRLMFGFSEYNENNHMNTIDNALYIVNGSLRYYQDGDLESVGAVVWEGDVLRIERDGSGDIVYYKNGFEIKRLAENINSALIVDISILDEAGEVSMAKSSFGISTCTDGVQNGYETGVDCGVACSACDGEEIVWTDLNNTTANTNTLTKNNVYGWNGGGASENVLSIGEAGWAEFIVVDNTKRLMFGFSEYNDNNHQNTIDNAIYVANGSLRYYQEGVKESNGPAVANGDVIRIERETNGDIIYYQNGQEIKRLQEGITTSLVVDVSILDEGGVVSLGIASFGIPTCNDGIQNGYEIGVDCGMTCSACDGEVIVWTDLNNTSAIINTLTKNNVYGWNGGGASENVLAIEEAGWAEFIIVDNTKRLMFGYSEYNENNHQNTIDNAIYVVNGTVRYYQDGVKESNGPTVSNGDVIKIERDANGDIVYFKNGIEIKRLSENITSALVVDVSLLDEGSVVSLGKASFGVPSCADGIQNGYETGVDCGVTCSACDGYDVVWIDLNNTTATDNTLTKDNGTGWNGGGASENYLGDGEAGWAEFIVVDNTKRLMFGFSQMSFDSHFNSIENAIYVVNGILKFYKSGTFVTPNGPSVSNGDVLRIAREQNGDIVYFKNGQEIRRFTDNIDSELIIDVSILDVGGEISTAKASFLPPSGCPVAADYDALRALYYATDGDGWTNNNLWLENCEPCGETTGTPWQGITCDANNRVIAINLSTNNLNGYIPTRISDISFLENLNLSGNSNGDPTQSLSGVIPAEIGELLALTSLNLTGNELIGSIPSTIGELQNLSILKLSDNLLEGVLPDELGDLISLTQFWADDNSITGGIPSSLGKQCNLLIFRANNNQLEGSIPYVVANLPSLGAFQVTNNLLSGCIPATQTFCQQNFAGLSLFGNACIENEGLIFPDASGVYTFCYEACTLDESGSCPDNQNNNGENTCTAFCAPCNCSGNSDFDALMALYQSTGGDNWENTINGDQPWGLDCDVCNWWGVTCNAQGRVFRLEVQENNMIGPIPPEIAGLTEIQELFLDENNTLGGPLPAELGQLINLTKIHLGRNAITGEIPPELGNLVNLEYLYIYENQLTGNLPEELSQLTQLQLLVLSDNMLSGCIPPSYASLCPNVFLSNNPCLSHNGGDETLFCANQTCLLPNDSSCPCSNGIKDGDEEDVDCGGSCKPCCPPSLDYDALMTLYNSTDGNNWTNTINGDQPWGLDCDVCNWKGVTCDGNGRVETLILTNNNLNGTIPSGIAGLTEIKDLRIRENSLLTGELPVEMANMTTLEYLSLRANAIEGTIPEWLTNLSNLNVLTLSFNNFIGQIPNVLTQMTSLTELRLGDNNYTGGIPTDIGNLSNLTLLSIANSGISGSLPQSLGTLQNLNTLSLSYNQLEGCIPASFANLCGRSITLHVNPCLSHNGSFTSFCAGVDFTYNDNTCGLQGVTCPGAAFMLPDLVVAQPTLPPTICPGETIDITVSLDNNGSAYASSSEVVIYLGPIANGNIVGNAIIDYVDANSTNSAVGFIGLPTNTPAGQYDLIFVADFNDEIDEGFNEDNNELPVQIEVSCEVNYPDLVMAEPDLPMIFCPGVPDVITLNLSNLGLEDAIPSTARVFLIENQSTGTFLTNVSIPNLASGTQIANNTSVTLDANLIPGQYELLFIADADDDVFEDDREGNNTMTIRITVACSIDVPDLIVTDPELPIGNVIQAGMLFPALCNAQNIGDAYAPPNVLKYYISENATFEEELDVHITSYNIAGLDVNEIQNIANSVTIPISTLAGDYFLIYFIDALEDVIEEDNDNNYNSIAIVVTAGPCEDGIPNNGEEFTDCGGPCLPCTGMYPDLVADYINAESNIAQTGDLLNVMTDFVNVGEVVEEIVNICLYLSEDENLSPNDIKLSDVNAYGDHPLNVVRSIVNPIYIPTELESGNYFIIFSLDCAEDIEELSESNNLLSYAINISNLDCCNTIQNSDPTCQTTPMPNDWGGAYEDLFDETQNTIDRPINTQLEVGATAGNFRVTELGAAHYSIPIALPPGQKVVPSVSLDYLSTMKNGVMGIGWSLTATSSIRRSSKEKYHHGTYDNIKFDDTDALMLDANYLYKEANTNIYRKEYEDFSIVEEMGAGTTRWFLVKEKSGIIKEYGNTTDSKKVSNGNIVYWALNKVYDQFGNYVSYHYEPGDNEHLLKRIEYTGNDAAGTAPYNKIYFEHIARGDENVAYQQGAEFKKTQLLSEVRIEADGLPVKKYQLTYGHKTANSQSIHSHLKSIKEIGSDASELNATLFKYGESNLGHESYTLQNMPRPDGSQKRIADLDGDGFDDIIIIEVDEDEQISFAKFYLNNPNTSGFDFVGSQDLTPFFSTRSKFWYWAEVIVNVAESLLTSYITGGLSTVQAIITIASEFGLSALLSPDFSGTGYTLSTYDFDGDQREELVIFSPCFSDPNETFIDYIDGQCTQQEVYAFGLSQSNTIVNNAFPIVHPDFYDFKNIWISDFDGDSKQDIVMQFSFTEGGFNRTYLATRLSSNDFEQKWINTDQINNFTDGATVAAFSFGDFNGDRKSDFLITNIGDNNLSILGDLRYNSATEEVELVPFDPSLSLVYPNNQNVLGVGDFNGDGLADIFTSDGRCRFNVGFSDGTKFISQPFVFNEGQYPKGGANGTNKVVSLAPLEFLRVADMNGDGLSDIIYFQNSELGGGDSPTINPYTVYYSTGTNFVSEEIINSGQTRADINMGDFNGDGNPDLLIENGAQVPEGGQNGLIHKDIVLLNKDSREFLLQDILDGFNNKISIEYEEITNDEVYDPFVAGSVNSFPLNTISKGLKVVSKVETPNGNLTGQNELSYKYFGAKYHREGRGVLGFEKN